MNTLKDLHIPGDPLILPNAWDVASAKIVEEAGFPAIATTSAGVAPALGYADRERTPAAEMFAALARITRAVAVPVTADIEHGYGLNPAELAERLAEAGVAGCNLEDSIDGVLQDREEHADFLAAVRQADPELVINARVDSCLRGFGLDDAIERGRRYREAGADCVYPITGAEVAELVEGIGGPVNVLFTPELTIAELADLGVARISYGEGVYAVAYERARAAVSAIRGGHSPY
ncbi:isocitrate lyase/phosphoenolpyruvate mutase family protein [Actinocorallia lasiicapitis]